MGTVRSSMDAHRHTIVLDGPDAPQESSPRASARVERTSQETACFPIETITPVFRLVGAKISVGLVPDPAGNFVLPAILLGERDDPKCASESAAQQVAAAREIVRIKHAGVSMRDDRVPLSRSLAVVSFAVAKPQLAEQPRSGSGAYFPLEQLPPLSDSDRQLLGIAFGAFLDEVLGDALTRRLLPRGVLHRKTDGFDGRSPLASRIGVNRAETPAPVLFGMLPDPFPMSSLRMLYEHILGVPLDRGNFRRQFLEVIDLGPLVALPIFQRGVPHRAGQLFTFDHRGWERWSHAGGDIASTGALDSRQPAAEDSTVSP